MITSHDENNFGLSSHVTEMISQQLSQFPQIEKAIIFGSRAMGNYKPGSDIDLALVGKNIDFQLIIRISSILNEQLPIPYKIDVVNYDFITNQKLIEHIKQYGKVFYKKKGSVLKL